MINKNLLTRLNGTGLQIKDIKVYQLIKDIIDELSLISSGETVKGAWTPNDSSGAGLVLPIAIASYSKNKDGLVIATTNLNYPVTASGAAASIGGLPFICDRTNFSQWPVIIGYQTAGLAMHSFVLLGTYRILFYLNNGVAVTNANLSNTGLVVTAIYQTSDL